MASISDSLRFSPHQPLGVPAVSLPRGKDLSTDCLVSLFRDTHILAATPGDHSAVLKLLVQCHQSHLAEDFQNRLDEPGYCANDRLLVQRAQQLVGHVQVSKHIGWFDQQRCPMARLQDFAVLPEFQSSELDSGLLDCAESIARDEGAVLGLLQTTRTQWFEQHGWSICRGQGHSRANTRSILAYLDAQLEQSSPGLPDIEIQSWRHYQLDSILDVHQQLAACTWGSWQRSLEAWQWLVGRKAHDQILIAVTNATSKAAADKLSAATNHHSDQPDDPAVVGYAVVKDSKLVEMMALPGYEFACTRLLQRACRDAIDRDHHCVELHTPATDPLHELMVTAGGSWNTSSGLMGGPWMVKLLSPQRWIERIYPVLHQRAREAGIARPLEIDFAVGKQYYRLTLTRRSARFEEVVETHSAIECTWQVLQDLLVSNLAYPEAIAQDKLRFSDPTLLRTLCALFPPKLIWPSPFPQLRL